MENLLLQPGSFLLGCNYWASHAGTHMWTDWQPQVVEADLAQLSSLGLQVLRVFPLWPVFQPLSQLYGGGGSRQEIRFDEEPLPNETGLSDQALERFAFLADQAHKNDLQLIVGLLTGWMSGRLFVPPALEELNVLTDPLALLWETRFVRGFVRRFKEHPAILAWDLGNECNCNAPVPNAAAAWTWTALISSTIRANDPSRPVVSGMHSLDEPDPQAAWRIRHQAELTDVLTTHPYPYFTPHMDQEPLNQIRNGLHATAQTRWYADVGGVAGLAEEVGTLGPMFASEPLAADYARTALFSLWAHDCRGMLWWCAYDQDRLANAPYDWTGVERELGLVRSDRTPKPVAAEYTRFRRFLQSLPVALLPPPLCEAVCILSSGGEPWGTAHTSFILAKQAGFDLKFQYPDQPLQDAPLYLLPSVSGSSPFSRRFWCELEGRIRDGATLYLSLEDAILSPFKEPFGLEVLSRQVRTTPMQLRLPALPGEPAFSLNSRVRYTFQAAGAEILGSEADGNPAFSRRPWGKGQIYFFAAPIERLLSTTPGGFSAPGAQPFWQIYRYIAREHLGKRTACKDNPLVGITEHPLTGDSRAVVLVNYSPQPQAVNLGLQQGWQMGEVWYGELNDPLSLPANDALVFTLRRKPIAI